MVTAGYDQRPLESLCVPGGIYIPHRFKRPYVRDPRYGLPYITGSDIGLAEPLHGCAYLSSKPGMVPHREKLMLEPGTILVTSSGDPGKPVYVSELFRGAIGSPDLLRIVPDQNRVSAGYLYAFLASPLGRGLLTQNTYGGVIPHIEAFHVLDIPVPRLNAGVEQEISCCIEQASANRVEANQLLKSAREQVYAATRLPRYDEAPVGRNLNGLRTYAIPRSSLGNRLEGRFHDIFVRDMHAAIRNNPHCDHIELQRVADIFLPNRGKWANVELGGVPLIGSGDMFGARPVADRMISLKISPEAAALIVKKHDILVARSGQIYSILGDAVITGRSFAGKAITEDAIRVVAHEAIVHPGYLFAFLTMPDYGYGQLVRTAYGTSIPHLSVNDLKTVVVPMPDELAQNAIGEEVLRAIELRDEANDQEDQAQALLAEALHFEPAVSSAVGRNGKD
jgi:type I restriction enzyme S subunit